MRQRRHSSLSYLLTCNSIQVITYMPFSNKHWVKIRFDGDARASINRDESGLRIRLFCFVSLFSWITYPILNPSPPLGSYPLTNFRRLLFNLRTSQSKAGQDSEYSRCQTNRFPPDSQEHALLPPKSNRPRERVGPKGGETNCFLGALGSFSCRNAMGRHAAVNLLHGILSST